MINNYSPQLSIELVLEPIESNQIGSSNELYWKMMNYQNLIGEALTYFAHSNQNSFNLRPYNF